MLYTHSRHVDHLTACTPSPPHPSLYFLLIPSLLLYLHTHIQNAGTLCVTPVVTSLFLMLLHLVVAMTTALTPPTMTPP